MNWDQTDFPDGPDAGFRHLRHFHLILLPIGLLLIGALVLLALLSIPTIVRMREKAMLERARERIFHKVRQALDAALGAPTGAAAIAGAQALVVIYDQQMGALTRLHDNLGGPLDAVRKATIPGKVKAAPPAMTAPDDAADPVSAYGADEAGVERDISMVEQVAAVREALERFAETWRRPTVDNLLRNAQHALLDAPGATSPSLDP